MADEGGSFSSRSPQQVLEEIVKVLQSSNSVSTTGDPELPRDSLTVQHGTNLNAGVLPQVPAEPRMGPFGRTNMFPSASMSIPRSSSVTEAVGRLFPGSFTASGTASSITRLPKTRKRPFSHNKIKGSKDGTGVFLKDVVLVPSPQITKIPRGKLRENLHSEGYVASAVEFCSDWSERRFRTAIETIYKEKLNELPQPLFHFVRATGNILVPPKLQPGQEFTAKVVKLLTGQGPIYIRAVGDIRSWSCEEHEEIVDVDEFEEESDFKQKPAAYRCYPQDDFLSSESETPNKVIPRDLSMPGPSILLTDEENLDQLIEMFPSRSSGYLRECLAIHGTVSSAALSLSSSMTDDNEDEDIKLLDPAFPPRNSNCVSLQSLLQQLQNNFSSEREKLKVDEEDLLNDALTYYKDPSFDPKKKLRIIYRGQPAADTGGVNRQFYTQLLHIISQVFFHGESYKSPIYNCDIVACGMMKLVGTIIVHSILQGGPGFPVFSPSVYHYLAKGDIDEAVQKMSIDDCSMHMKDFINKVAEAVEVSSIDQEETTNILSDCGLTVTLTNDNKMRVIQSVIIHDVIGRPKIVLDQLREGLGTLDFGAKMKQFPELFQELFLHKDDELCGIDVINIIDFPSVMSENERSTHNYLTEFLQNAPQETLKQFLIFATGSPCLPNFGLGKIAVKFDHVSSSIFASTCLQSLTFPHSFPDKSTFSLSLEAVIDNAGKAFNCV